MSESLDLVRSIYAALNEAYRTGEYATADLARYAHPDVVLRPSGMFPESGDYHGYDALRQFSENQAQAFESMRVEPSEFIEAGDRVVVPIRFGGKARHTGIEAMFEVVHVWTVSDGKVTELAMYQSRDDALKAVGLAEQAMSQENVEVVEQAVAAINARDLDSYLACCTQDVELVTPLASIGAVYEGPAGIRQFLADIEDTGPGFHIELQRAETVGTDRVLAYMRVSSRGRASGIATDSDSANVYDLVAGKIKRIRIFLDRAEALRAVGLGE